MHIRFGSRKFIVICAGALIIAIVGAAWYNAARSPAERLSLKRFSQGLLFSTWDVVEAFQLATTPRLADKMRLYLRNAERRLSAVADPEEPDRPESYRFIEEYIEQIHSVREAAEGIQDAKEGNEVFLEAFRRLARHQLTLRAIDRRSSEAPLSVLDRARYENMAVQEQLVKYLTSSSSATEATPTPTVTEQLLACPDCNVIIVSLTTLRKDHIGLYGYDTPTTPNIDAFFKNSLRFTNAFAPSAWTVPDAVSLFTSLFPYSHGIALRESFAVPLLYNESVKTFAQILSARGYRTAAFTGGGDYNARISGLDRGFDFYLDETNYEAFNVPGDHALGSGSLLYTPLGSFVELSSEWLTKNGHEKFFLLVQGYDTHCPYTPHEPYASQFTAGMESALDYSICYTTYDKASPIVEGGEVSWEVTALQRGGTARENIRISEDDVRYLTALYDARIAEADDHLGSLFEKIRALGLEKNTIVILMSEHGEMLGENGWFMRGGTSHGTAYEPALNFPLLIKHPKITESVVIDDLAQTVDMMPTLLTMLGIPDPQARIREGAALSFSAFGDPPTNEYAYAASVFLPSTLNSSFNIPSATEVIRGSEWKLIKNTLFTETGFRENSVSYELYNIKNDPHEENDLSATDPKRAQDLKQKLQEWLGHFTRQNTAL